MSCFSASTDQTKLRLTVPKTEPSIAEVLEGDKEVGYRSHGSLYTTNFTKKKKKKLQQMSPQNFYGSKNRRTEGKRKKPWCPMAAVHFKHRKRKCSEAAISTLVVRGHFVLHCLTVHKSTTESILGQVIAYLSSLFDGVGGLSATVATPPIYTNT